MKRASLTPALVMIAVIGLPLLLELLGLGLILSDVSLHPVAQQVVLAAGGLLGFTAVALVGYCMFAFLPLLAVYLLWALWRPQARRPSALATLVSGSLLFLVSLPGGLGLIALDVVQRRFLPPGAFYESYAALMGSLVLIFGLAGGLGMAALGAILWWLWRR